MIDFVGLFSITIAIISTLFLLLKEFVIRNASESSRHIMCVVIVFLIWTAWVLAWMRGIRADFSHRNELIQTLQTFLIHESATLRQSTPTVEQQTLALKKLFDLRPYAHDEDHFVQFAPSWQPKPFVLQSGSLPCMRHFFYGNSVGGAPCEPSHLFGIGFLQRDMSKLKIVRQSKVIFHGDIFMFQFAMQIDKDIYDVSAVARAGVTDSKFVLMHISQNNNDFTILQ